MQPLFKDNEQAKQPAEGGLNIILIPSFRIIDHFKQERGP